MKNPVQFGLNGVYDAFVAGCGFPGFSHLPKTAELLSQPASQLQGVIQRFLLETGALTEPDAIEPVLSASSPLLMVDKLADRTEQAPSSPTGLYQYSTPAMALVKRLKLFEGALVSQALTWGDWAQPLIHRAEPYQPELNALLFLSIAGAEGRRP